MSSFKEGLVDLNTFCLENGFTSEKLLKIIKKHEVDYANISGVILVNEASLNKAILTEMSYSGQRRKLKSSAVKKRFETIRIQQQLLYKLNNVINNKEYDGETLKKELNNLVSEKVVDGVSEKEKK